MPTAPNLQIVVIFYGLLAYFQERNNENILLLPIEPKTQRANDLKVAHSMWHIPDSLLHNKKVLLCTRKCEQSPPNTTIANR